jgi:hypothetical protein
MRVPWQVKDTTRCLLSRNSDTRLAIAANFEFLPLVLDDPNGPKQPFVEVGDAAAQHRKYVEANA